MSEYVVIKLYFKIKIFIWFLRNKQDGYFTSSDNTADKTFFELRYDMESLKMATKCTMTSSMQITGNIQLS